ncbi:MAG: Anaphase-promoting complex, cyclosome, subunit 3 [Thermoplasmata archaeon]|jgi:hypothetical protein|nr:Anaphase-promoting complex, cyclosome, subunit 3 [Thermoplasmata archaeon]
MRLARSLLLLLVLLLAVAGAAQGGKPDMTHAPAHGKHAPAPSPSPAPDPTPAPVAQPDPEPVAEPVPNATVEMPAPPARKDPEATLATESAFVFTAAAAPEPPTGRDPIFATLGGASSAPATVASQAALPAAGASGWLLPIAGLAALGAVVALGVRPLPKPALAPRPVRLNVVPIDVPSLLRAGEAAIKAGRAEEAAAWFAQAAALQADLAVAHFCHGMCLVALQRHEQAREAFQRAYDLDPMEGSYRLELARACARTARGPEAMDALAPLLAAAPELAQDLGEDPAFASLKDHPRFLALVGLL